MPMRGVDRTCPLCGEERDLHVPVLVRIDRSGDALVARHVISWRIALRACSRCGRRVGRGATIRNVGLALHVLLVGVLFALEIVEVIQGWHVAVGLLSLVVSLATFGVWWSRHVNTRSLGRLHGDGTLRQLAREFDVPLGVIRTVRFHISLGRT